VRRDNRAGTRFGRTLEALGARLVPAWRPVWGPLCLSAEDAKMAAIEEDDRPKKKIVHEIGQDLALLSVKELDDRISLLNDEIARLQAALAKKRASRSAADQFFKK
jgi:uncharacterized small protein (DUF1192 family)